MEHRRVQIEGMCLDLYTLNTVVVGTGAAGLNAANRLYSYGQRDIALVTEGTYMGTSRNTGSDKQTYYKLSLSGKQADSVRAMAESLFQGGCVDGDLALVEAALSGQCFYYLVELGVPFPHNEYGEYVGYKTDHDESKRATSAGPLTSKYMTEKLQEEVEKNQIPILDGYQVIGILTRNHGEKKEAIGLLTLNLHKMEDVKSENPQLCEQCFTLFNTRNIIYATGGPAGMYGASVYPESQSGGSGLAFEIGVKGKNLTESQYGISSIKFRWNLSGSYQQVIPRYVSIDGDGVEREFLKEYFSSYEKMFRSIFLKGYQWPFDPYKINNEGSSLIDMLVYIESIEKGRRVFLDFTKNPSDGNKNNSLDFRLLGEEGYTYLKKSSVLFGTPIDRLAHMNPEAVKLYDHNGIDLYTEYLEIGVCAQHNNGGLSGDAWWQSNIKHFFVVGEANGSHGIHRPGGSALNAGQVGGLRAAQFIASKYNERPLKTDEFLRVAKGTIIRKINLGKSFYDNLGEETNVMKLRQKSCEYMTKIGAQIRELKGCQDFLAYLTELIEGLADNTQIKSLYELPQAYKNLDIFLSQYVYISAIINYIEFGGESRGSSLTIRDMEHREKNKLKELLRWGANSNELDNKVQEVMYEDRACKFRWRDVRPIPDKNNWFEEVWQKYREGELMEEKRHDEK